VVSDLESFLPMASAIGRAIDLLHENKEKIRPFGINDLWLVRDCPRKAWYKMQSSRAITNYSQLKRIGNINNEIKRNVKTDLFGIGLTVKNQGKEVIALDPETGLMISGRADGILDNLEALNMGSKDHLLSISSCGERNEFTSLKEKGFEHWHLKHRIQVSIIAHLLKLTRIIVIVESRNDSQRYYERVKIDKILARRTLERCFTIMKMSCAPEKRKCQSCHQWEVKCCEYREECW